MTLQQALTIAQRINAQEVVLFEQAQVRKSGQGLLVEAIDRRGRWATFSSPEEYVEYVNSH